VKKNTFFILLFVAIAANAQSIDSLDVNRLNSKYDSVLLQSQNQSEQITSISSKLRESRNNHLLTIKQLEETLRYYQIGFYLTGAVLLLVFLRKQSNLMSSQRKRDKVILEKIIEKKNLPNKQTTSVKWIVVGESVIGRSHITSGKPCQDSHFFHSIDNSSWGIAVVCDGAGSAENSDLGAKFIATNSLPKHIINHIKNEKWIGNNILPSPSEWQKAACTMLLTARADLNELANEKSIELSSLACTVIVLIYSPFGILVAHIGDGRAGYCDENGIWKSVIIPHKGEESNQTVFLTSKNWFQNTELKMSGVSIPECRVVSGKPSAFVLMSDGCEQHSFECSVIDSKDGSWSDPNRPYEKFFSPLVQTLRTMITNPSFTDFQDPWKKFLEGGTEGLKNESDDKTMILGILN
jgi:hypothetical protein